MSGLCCKVKKKKSLTMPSTGNKATTPFKTMDIKAALLSSGSRKRKASSPQVCKTEVKKLSLDSEEVNDVEIQILDEGCGITVTLDQSALNTSLGDCKENKDINSSEAVTSVENVNSKENIELNNLKEDIASNVNKTSLAPKLASAKSPKPTQIESDKEIEQSLSDKCKNSDHSSCDDLSTSAINSSINISQNSGGQTPEEKEMEMETESTNKKTESDAVGGNTQKNEANSKEKTKKRKMTPAEAKKRAEEREQKQKERLLKKEELENKKKERLLEKEKRLKEKLIKKEREELERKERERIKQEKKEQEEKEKMMKQKEKDEKLQKKLEEQKKKEELKQKKDEELKKAEEEKLKKLEKEQKEKEKAERAKERAKAAFAKFFVRGDASTFTPAAQVLEKEGAFKPFQVSDDMILAPVVQPAAQERFDRKQLDHYLECQDGKELYLQILASGSYKDVRQRKRAQKLPSSEADVIILDKNAQAEFCLMAKLLQFNENVRPPYWGTWRKKSKSIRPRNPWGQDEIFDYTVDSDDEWDEGGPGESLSGTEEEDQAEEGEDDYDIDNQFIVPHGYLSDEEEKMEDDDEEVNDPEKQKALLKIKLQEFENERKKKTTELKPIILGCYFCNDPAFQDAGLGVVLQAYYAEMLTETPVPTRYTFKTTTNTSESPKCISAKKKKSCPVPAEAMPPLIRFIHGNIRNRKVLSEEFHKLWTEQNSDSSGVKQEDVAPPSSMEVDESKSTATEPTSDSSQTSQRQFYRTIKEIATYGKPPEPTINKCCWWVHENIREKYGLLDTPFPNDKSYVTSVPVKVEDKQLATVKAASIKEFLSPI